MPEAKALTAAQIADLVTEGARLQRIFDRLKAKEERLKEIKEQLRTAAGEKDATFQGRNGIVCVVKQIAETIVRTVPPALVVRARRLAGKFSGQLFNLTPAKSFELEAFKLLPKQQAQNLTKLLKTPSTARVSFGNAT